MTKHITITLTEDQARDIVGLCSHTNHPNQWYLDTAHLRIGWDKQTTPERISQTRRKVAFRKRVIAKLNAELVKL